MKSRIFPILIFLVSLWNSELANADALFTYARTNDTLIIHSVHIYHDPVIFYNVENPILFEIRPAKYSCKLEIIKHSKNSELIRKNDTLFVKPLNLDPVDITYVFTNLTTGVKDTINRRYNIHSIGDVIVNIKGGYDEVTSIENVLKSGEITAKLSETELPARIIKFYVWKESQMNDLIESDSRFFTGQQRNVIMGLKDNEKFLIKVIVKLPDNTFRTITKSYTIAKDGNLDFLKKVVDFTSCYSLIRENIRVRLLGFTSRKDSQTIKNIINEINPLLETTQIKLVKHAANITIYFDTCSFISTEEARKYNKGIFDHTWENNQFGGYSLLMGFFGSGIFNFFRVEQVINIKNLPDSLRELELWKAIAYRLFTTKPISDEESIYGKRTKPGLSEKDKFIIQTVYSKKHEEKMKNQIDTNSFYDLKMNLVRFIFYLITFLIYIIVSEVVTSLGLFVSFQKRTSNYIRNFINAVLIAQLLMIILMITDIIYGRFEMSWRYFGTLEKGYLPLIAFAGLLLGAVNWIIKRIKRYWIVIITDSILTLVSFYISIEILYFFERMELIQVRQINPEGVIIALLIVLYRIYNRYEKNKVRQIIEEKELEITKQKEMKTKAELIALQARINPHFLYNSLNSIASIAEKNSKKVEEMALGLSRLFRYNLNKGNDDFSTIKEEVEMSRTYLDIEKVRFGERFEYELNVFPHTENYKVPRFLLQPLVENAVKHGISKITGQGFIKLNIDESQTEIIISVYDNGPDFPNGPVSGYGLQNTYDKLAVLYKKPYRIDFINGPEKHIKITLTK